MTENELLENDKSEIQNNIKHLVISGGGHVIFGEYSILKESNLSGFWDLKNIESIYGTSAGALLGLTICLLSIANDSSYKNVLNWDILDNYLIYRPWQNVFKIDILTVIQSITKDGILNISTIIDMFSPIFKTVDIPIDITLKDFFEISKKDFHVFSVEMDSFEINDISHKTHPDWTVIDAVYASSCLPIVFSSFKKDNKIYTDGGIQANYPLIHLLKNNPDINTDEILAIKLNYNKINDESTENMSVTIEKENTQIQNTIPDINTINENTNTPTYLYDIALNILTKMFEFIEKHNMINQKNKKIKYEINMYNKYGNLLYEIYLASNSSEERKKLMEKGKQTWEEFYKEINL